MLAALRPGPLSIGMAPLGGLYGPVAEAEATATLATALESGVTHFDTAPHYGRGLAEERLGSFLANIDGHATTVSTKVGRWVRKVPVRPSDDIFLGAPPGESTYDYLPADAAIRERVRQLHELCAAHGTTLHTVALNHARRFPGVTTTVVGVRSPAEVEAAVAALSAELPEALWVTSTASGPNTPTHRMAGPTRRTAPAQHHDRQGDDHMNRRFEIRVAVVTGAASGIGWEIASRLRDEGAAVVAGDLNPDGVPEGTLGVAVDVAVEDRLEALIETCITTHGRIDVLCNNAGVGGVTDVLNCSTEEWDRLFSVNVRGVFLGIRAALPHMLAARRGVIVNTASVAASIGLPDRAAYCASKGAVVALTKQVAVQYAAHGIRCNCVSPGTVDSPWVGRLLDQAEDPAAIRRALIARQPLGRLATPGEIADLVVYLASDQASFVTGSDWLIDGGMAAG